MKRSLINLSLMLLSFCSIAQEGFYLQAGGGISYSKGEISLLTESLESYEQYAASQWPSDAMATSTELSETSLRPAITIQGGFKLDNLIVGMTWYNVKINQEVDYIRNSSYGRTFTWEERRNDVLVDFGYNADRFAIIASLGSNFNNFTMTSYQRYPDGSRNLDKRFTNNGVYRVFDAGFSYGIGVKLFPKKHIGVDIRYYNALANLPGEAESDAITLTDNSFSRYPGTSEFPADWNRAKSFSNSISPNFQRSFLQLSLTFQLSTDY